MGWEKIQRLDKGWKITDGIEGRFCNKDMRFPKVQPTEQWNRNLVGAVGKERRYA
jgi:hypothetical protein